MEAKKRRISSTDWDKVEKHVSEVFEARKKSKFRAEHERIWKEVDRQVSMTPMQKKSRDGKPLNTWHSALEMGELAKASEIITSDVMRIMFTPGWFQPHVELEKKLGANGRPAIDDKKQRLADGLLRALMTQQHKDFGFKERFRLSVKEALHHGSFAAEVRFDREMMVKEGSKVKVVGAPVWVPYSMWNAYPDPSPSVIGTNLFYTGAMILVEYEPLAKLKRKSGEGWITSRLAKIEKRINKNNDNDTEDIELIKYKGDITIERGEGDIYLPNSEVILANGKLVYYRPNPLPYPNVIFAGYERQDVRDPYYTSPIIKLSPSHKALTIVTNKFLDAVSLKVEPPIEYDGNDPDYVMNDGPEISPGAKTPTKAMGNGFKQLDIGEPKYALEAMQFLFQQHQEGLGVSSLRMGVQTADRQTATEANLQSQGSEVRTMEFIAQLEPQALLPFLYMQHELNRMEMEEYTFYSDEMQTPDFVRATKQDIQANAHFEIVGSRGVLGEEKRREKLAQTTAFFSGNPLFAPKLNTDAIMLDMYRDAGKKNPEEYIKQEEQGPKIPPELQQQLQQMQQIIQQQAQALQEAQTGMRVKFAELQAKQETARADFALRQAELEQKKRESAESATLNRAELAAQIQESEDRLQLDRLDSERRHMEAMAKLSADFEAKVAAIQAKKDAEEDAAEMESTGEAEDN